VTVIALPDGEPLIVGGWFGTSRTWIENAGSAALTRPSFTEMTMFENVPMCVEVGVPLKRPVEVLKLAHDGRPEITKRSVSPLFGSLALGWKL
jgi:hypothetical protein